MIQIIRAAIFFAAIQSFAAFNQQEWEGFQQVAANILATRAARESTVSRLAVMYEQLHQDATHSGVISLPAVQALLAQVWAHIQAQRARVAETPILNTAGFSEFAVPETRQSSMARRVPSDISIRTSASIWSSASAMNRQQALLIRELSEEELWNQILLDLEEISVETRPALLHVARHFADGNNARNASLNGRGRSREDPEMLLSWLRQEVRSVTQVARRQQRRQVQQAGFADRYLVFRRRLDYLYRYFNGTEGMQGYVEQTRAIMQEIQNVTIFEAAERALNAGRARSRAAAARQPQRQEQTQVQAQVQITYPNTARRADASTAHVDVVENAGEGDCLFYALGTDRDSMFRLIQENRRTEEVNDVFVRSLVTDPQAIDYAGWSRAMRARGANRRIGDVFDVELWSAAMRTPVRVFRLTEGVWRENTLLNPTNSDQLERWIGYSESHWVELQPRAAVRRERNDNEGVGPGIGIQSSIYGGLAGIVNMFNWRGSTSRQ